MVKVIFYTLLKKLLFKERIFSHSTLFFIFLFFFFCFFVFIFLFFIFFFFFFFFAFCFRFALLCCYLLFAFYDKCYLSQCMGFPTVGYVRPAKP